MKEWENHKHGENEFDLSHMDEFVFSHTRKAKEQYPERITKFSVNFSHHCFTGHYCEDLGIYDHEKNEEKRFFSKERYDLSFNLPEIIKNLPCINPYVKVLIDRKRRESIFHLENDVNFKDYRIFLGMSLSKNPKADIRIFVRSAHPEDVYAKPVAYSGTQKFLMVADRIAKGLAFEPKRRSR